MTSNVIETRICLITRVQKRGISINSDEVIGITVDVRGKEVWLEKGRTGVGGSGLAHILEQHGEQFVRKGISREELPDYLLQAIKTGKVVGMQGSRPVYEFIYKEKRQRVAITIANNGYIVGANPKSLPKEE